MRAILTGGGGLIGRALAASLVADGYETILLSRRPESVGGLPSGARAEKWDGRTAEGWGSLASGADVIVNLAGASLAHYWTASYKQQIAQSRSGSGAAIVQAVEAATVKPQLVIQQSGVGHYGLHQDEIISEANGSLGSDFMAQVTVGWEGATMPVESLGVRRVVTRSGLIFAGRGGYLPLMVLPYRFFVGGRVGSGKQWLSWMHIDDEVAAIRFLMAHDEASGAFNLCAPQPMTNAKFGKVVGRVLHRPSAIPAPAFAMRLLFGEMSTVLLDGQRVVPERLLGMGFLFRFAELEPALQNCMARRS